MQGEWVERVEDLSVFAVIVLYKPQMERLKRLTGLLEKQVEGIVLVDNTDDDSHLSDAVVRLGDRVKTIALGRNTGIGFALNRGIEFCLSQGARFVVSFDQDSCVSENFIEDLKCSYLASSVQFGEVACVGPNPVRSDGTSYYQNVNVQDYIVLPELITSGSLFPAHVFQEIGLFREDLFIDWVDFEWCWRASSRGYVSIMATNVVMDHTVGAGDLVLFGRPLCAVSAPLRNYYQYRNFCNLFLRCAHFHWKRKIYFLGRRLVSLVLIFFFMNARMKRLHLVFRGIAHGVTGRLGSYL